MPKVHHTAICTNDIDESLRFWRDGMGFEVTMDLAFEGPWTTLFGGPADRLRSIFLGDPSDPSGGILELIDFGAVPEAETPATTRTGFVLVSVYRDDLDDLLGHLEGLGFTGEVRRETVNGVGMAVVFDPSGVMIEVVGLAPPTS
jgi:glyoxylase I family protein